MRERRRSDVGRLRVRSDVDELGDVVRHRREPFQAVGRDRLDPHLQREVRDHGREVAVAGALADAVDRALHLPGARPHCRERVGDRASGVVVRVDRDDHVVAEVRDDVTHDLLDLERQRSAVRVAQHEGRSALLGRGLEHAQRELRVALVAIEEVLGVEHHAEAVAAQVLDRVGDHGDALVEGRSECLGDVVVPRLADDAHRGRAGRDEVRERRVVVDLPLDPAGRAERDEGRGGELQLGHGPTEELFVLRVRAGPATLDPGDAEVVELLGDAQLVVDGEGDALELRAVTEGRVEDLDRFARLPAPSTYVSRHVRPIPCIDRPGRGRPSRTRRRSPW